MERSGELEPPPSTAERAEELILPVSLAALTTYLGFEAGGYFADTQGWVAVLLLVAVAARALTVGRPPRGLTWPLAAAAGGLALLAGWTLLSAGWSGAPYRALIEFDRVLLYLAALLFFASARRPRRTLELLPLAFAVSAFLLCGAGLFVQLMPDDWPFSLPEANARMQWPVTYENGLGVLAALGILFTLHCAAWRRGHPAVRVAAAAAMPILVAALVLTYSRGAIATGLVGLVVLCVLGRSRGLLAALVATVLPAVLAARAAYDADLVSGEDPRAAAAIEQGHELAGTLVTLSVVAGVVMLVVLVAARFAPGRLVPSPPVPALAGRGRQVRLGAIAALAIAVVVAVATGAVGEAYDRTIASSPVGESTVRERITSPTSFTQAQSRPEYWRIAIDEFERRPVAGSGAETYGIAWARERTIYESSSEGHSLYLETLAELGLVGGILIGIALGTLVITAAAHLRGPRRPLYAAIVAAQVTWLLHAALDWDWEMPAVTLWLFAFGGCVLSASPRRLSIPGRYSLRTRVLVAGACLLAALVPLTVARSQGDLNRSVDQFASGDCIAAERSALDSIDTFSARPEAHAIVAYCEARRGDRDAVRWIDAAIARDPDNWQYHYGRALVLASLGRDPRASARRAYALAPLESLARDARDHLAVDDPREWRMMARRAPLPVAPRPVGGSEPPAG